MTVHIIQGDVREELPKLPADAFDCIVTSPPYFGLRDYGCEGQIGLEPTVDAYLETMVEVCRQLRRVLKPSGVFFLNIGDSYAGSGRGGYAGGKSGLDGSVAGQDSSRVARGSQKTVGFHEKARHGGALGRAWIPVPVGFKPKDLCLIPQRLGIALQQDGWWVRSHIIWHKPNPMPESITDRPTSAHETIWMLTKSEHYFWDADAVAEDAVRGFAGSEFSTGKTAINQLGRGSIKSRRERETRNLRNVWTIATQPSVLGHFALMPRDIAELCLKAACPDGGYVLDPFGGAGTTGLVADRLGRNATLIELNPAYAEMARRRIEDDSPLFTQTTSDSSPCEAGR
jgi:DNA modification methylase